jgi:hypothetical protein
MGKDASKSNVCAMTPKLYAKTPDVCTKNTQRVCPETRRYKHLEVLIFRRQVQKTGPEPAAAPF